MRNSYRSIRFHPTNRAPSDREPTTHPLPPHHTPSPPDRRTLPRFPKPASESSRPKGGHCKSAESGEQHPDWSGAHKRRQDAHSLGPAVGLRYGPANHEDLDRPGDGGSDHRDGEKLHYAVVGGVRNEPGPFGHLTINWTS